MTSSKAPLIAIACGGTGGHLFPGLAVGRELVARGAEVLLLVSPKEVDQQAVRSVVDMGVATLPAAVGLTVSAPLKFAAGSWRAYQFAARLFRSRRPAAVLAMGGFTSAPPVLAGRRLGARAYLHESNTIPGKANRWLSRFVDLAFIGFPQTRDRLATRKVAVVGTPVRGMFLPRPAGPARQALGLLPDRPVLLVMGGSQGALGINQLVTRCLPALASALPGLQFLHLTGSATGELQRVTEAYQGAGLSAVVQPFLAEMDVALGAASLTICRAGASSLAELAAMRVPAILIPYPSAADNHQYFNARALVEAGAARLLPQREATPESLVALIQGVMGDDAGREQMRLALERFHRPDAAVVMAEAILGAIPGFVPVRPGGLVAAGVPLPVSVG